jgi:predicted dehydrogenase
MDITSTKAFARLDYINQTITLYEDSNSNKDNKYNSFNEFVFKFSLPDEVKIGIKRTEPLLCRLEEFIDAIISDREPFVTGEEAYNALEIALRI